MATTPSDAARLQELARLRRVRDRIDRDFAQPLDVEALARGVHVSAGHLSREFKRAYGESPYSYLMTRRITRFSELVGMPPSSYREQVADVAAGLPACVEKRVTRPIRNREAPGSRLHLA